MKKKVICGQRQFLNMNDQLQFGYGFHSDYGWVAIVPADFSLPDGWLTTTDNNITEFAIEQMLSQMELDKKSLLLNVLQPVCYIMRGLPGSGKTTWLRNHSAKNAIICSADDYRIVEGQYVFKAEDSGRCHRECFKKFVSSCISTYAQVHCDNTNMSILEIAPYYRVAEAYGYQVKIINCVCDPELAEKSNTHGVPHATYTKMLEIGAQFNNLMERPRWWKVLDVFRKS